MKDVFDVAETVTSRLDDLGFPFCIIGGIAVLAWGEARVTRDVDLSVLTGFGLESQFVSKLLEVFPARYENALEFALANRVLLCQSPEGIGIDFGLAAFPYEEEIIARSTRIEILPGLVLPIASAEDLIVMKVFAGRPIDWQDVQGILVRQGDSLDWEIIKGVLPGLLELIDASDRMDRLRQLRDETSKL